MNIQLLSDLHLESQPHFQAQPAPGADLLVLAGDVGSYQLNSGLVPLGDADFGLGRFSPLHGWPCPVLFVPGNHEYDGLDFDATHERLRLTCQRLGIIWLEREVLQFQNTRFIGTTLWTDFDALASKAGSSANPNALAQQLKARDKAMRAANFYLRKAAISRHGQPFLAEPLRDHALACQAWLSAALAQPFAGDTVVVTHFAPSLRSADPRYGHTPGTAGFCNGLDELLGHARLWLHGHLHCPSDYQHKGCRVVANPLGYARKKEQGAFDPGLLIRL